MLRASVCIWHLTLIICGETGNSGSDDGGSQQCTCYTATIQTECSVLLHFQCFKLNGYYLRLSLSGCKPVQCNAMQSSTLYVRMHIFIIINKILLWLCILWECCNKQNIQQYSSTLYEYIVHEHEHTTDI